MDLKLPHLGEGADSGTVVNLFVKEGDQIAKDQSILELENEKAVATIPSTAAGTVARIFVKAGDKISVGQRILALEENGSVNAQRAPARVPEPQRDEGVQQSSREQTPVAEEGEAPVQGE
jgi:pyruvate dehydrogenase E2 component (dihydrolipoamide acetyltransferase)